MKNIHLSETKLNQLASEISERLFESHYFNQDSISGEALNNFCDHDQINKFLLFQVYQVWQLQISRFKHPYFNFEHPEVKDLLAKLQNLLSRNIAIKKEDFKSLLYKAVLNNLRLLTNPKSSLQQFFFQNQEKIAVQVYEKYIPFFSDFDFVTNSILRYFKKHEIKTAEKDVFSVKFDRVLEVYNQRSEQNDDTYRSLRFYKLTGHRLEEVIKEDQEEITARQKKEELEESKRKLKEQQEKEAEVARLVAEKRKEEEVKRQQEAENQKKTRSFFDEIPAHDEAMFDLDDQDIPSAPQVASSQVAEKEDKSPSTIKDQVKEEEPVWKKLKKEASTAPTQAEKLKENTTTQTNSLMDRIKQTVDKKTEEVREVTKKAIEEAPKDKEAAKSEEASIAKKDSVIADLQDKKEKVETLLNKVQEDPKEDSQASILEKASSTDKKPNSLVDLLRAKDTKQKSDAKPEEKNTKIPPVSAASQGKSKEASSSGSLLEKYKQKTKDLLQKEVKPNKEKPLSIADKYKPKQTDDTPSSGSIDSTTKPAKADDIPIHKQYRFVQKVFGGNNVRFRIIVDKINNAKSTQEVEDILDKYVFSNPDVSREDETVKEFIQLMRK